MWATAIVMPRAFSSGALSMESKLRNFTFGLFFPRTLVMAAVRVVLPWSMCPIVPIFTCGLLRSNFSFDISENLLCQDSLQDQTQEPQTLEPLTRIELVTSSLPRTRSTN